MSTAPVRIKLNQLTTLHDARYGAALGVDYVTFTLERGSMFRISPELIQEIAPWVAGPQLVVALGDDLSATDGQDTLLADIQGLREYNALTPLPEAALQTPFGLRLAPAHPTELTVENLERLKRNLPAAQYLEVSCAATDNPWLEGLLKLLPTSVTLLLDLDPLSHAQVRDLMPLVNGFSYGKKLADDFTALDYDAFEALLERYRPE